jgi:hypothetical protein
MTLFLLVLGKGFAECNFAFAECNRHPAKNQPAAVNHHRARACRSAIGECSTRMHLSGILMTDIEAGSLGAFILVFVGEW